MNWSDFDRYLQADHLQGKARLLEIAKIAVEEVWENGKHVRKPVIYFKATDKGLVLSNLNRKMLARLFGDEVTGCVGKRVRVQAVRVMVGGKERFPLRLSDPGQIPIEVSQGYMELVNYARGQGIETEAVDRAVQAASGDFAKARRILEQEYVLKAV